VEKNFNANANNYQHYQFQWKHTERRKMNDFVESVEFGKFHKIKLERIQNYLVTNMGLMNGTKRNREIPIHFTQNIRK
jgi:hypothetical protein